MKTLEAEEGVLNFSFDSDRRMWACPFQWEDPVQKLNLGLDSEYISRQG